MYRPSEKRFVFRLRRSGAAVVAEGSSPRYTAIVLIGLAREPETSISDVLHGQQLHEVCASLAASTLRSANVGDVALALWALEGAGSPDAPALRDRLLSLGPDADGVATVEAAWALTALCLSRAEAATCDRLASRLVACASPGTAVFPHVLGGGRGLRAHVSCFADMVYPIQALARAAHLLGRADAINTARAAAARICEAQGRAGQWWWHYDNRTGEVIEGYPVYAVHQDSMAPMALFDLGDVSETDYSTWIARGLRWLESAPELGGRSLVDEPEGLIWRKVARVEPGKASRVVQAAASRLHPALRAPALDRLWPPAAIDFEDRPYHLGWILQAWPAARASAWRGAASL